MVGVSDVNSSSTYSSSCSSSSEDEGDRRKNKKSSKNLSRLSCYTRDGFSSMARSSGSKNSHQSDSDSDSDDDVCDKLPFLHEKNERPKLARKGILVYRLPPYNPSGERMVAIFWNHSSFVLIFSLPIFPWYFHRTSLRVSW
jgi:hypothetical protein